MLRKISIIIFVFSIFIAGIINAIDYKFKRHVVINGPFAEEVSGTHSLWVDLRPEIPFPNFLLFGEKIFSSYGDTLENPDRSKLQLKVNGNQLIFPHTLHADIRKQGNGAFSHWGDVLIFSLPQGVENTSSTFLDISFKTLNPMLYRLVLLISCLLIIGSSFYLLFDFWKLHYCKSQNNRYKQIHNAETLKENKTAYMPHLDGLRAIAVLSVIFFHLGIPGFTGGFIGVDVFLVISGFLITNIIKQEIVTTGKFSFTSFYKKRIRRLTPALLCVLVATTFFSSLFLSTSLLKAYGGELFSSIFGVSNIFFWKQVDYFDLSAKLKPLLHTWSLSVEWQFYLIWPFIVAFLYKSKFKSFALYVGIIFLLSLILNFYQVPDPANKFFPIELQDRKSTIFYLLPFRVFEFCIGAYLVEIIGKIKIRRIYSDIFSFFGICLIIISTYFYSDSLIFPSYFALAPCLGAAILILFGGGETLISKLLKNKLLVAIGILSYSLYLVHWPVIVFYDYLTYKPNEIARLLTILFITFLSSFILWKFIEVPFRKKCSLFLISALAFSMSALGFYLFYFSDGWTWRIPNKELLNGIENIEDFHKTYYGGIQFSNIPTSSSIDADILLLGDSHGMHYAEGLYKEVALPRGLSLHILAGTSCFHLPRLVRIGDGHDWIKSAEYIQGQIDKICSNSKKPLLIISHSWLFQQSKSVFLDKNGSSKSSPIQIMHILNSITELKNRTGAPILVIGEVPGENGPSCFEELQRPKFGRRFSFDQLSSSNPDEIRFKFNFQMAEYANKNGDFYFIDPGLALLDNGKYINFDLNGNPIYSDDYHLSVFGSRFVISHFKDVILKHINENSLK